MDLAGTWRAAPANDELRRVFAEPGYSEAQASSRTGAIEEWTDIDVPGHWRSAARFSDNDGAVLYRRTFSATRPGEDRRVWLKFDGIFYQGDVWLDGAYVGDTEGYYLPHDFDVTEQFNERTEHVVAVEVSCPPQNNQAAKRNLTGMFQSSDHLDRRWNPGGIWQSVHVEETGPIRIKRLRCISLDASTERAELAIRAVVDCARAGTVRLRSDVGTTFHEFDHAVAKGSNRVEWRVVVERPMLWWPLALGRPHMTDVVVSVFDVPTPSAVTLPPVEAEAGATSELGQPSDSRRFRTGLREVRMKNWIFQINGERMHLKGANIGPVRMAIGDATVAELRQDIAAAQDAGLDFLRVNAHVTHPSFYDAADEMGMLVWQDLPLQRGYARSVRKQAVRQAGEAIDLLGHHPSIIHWCGHNEPLAFDADPETMAGSTRKAAELKGRYLALQALPTWNKSVLDFAIHRALSKSDPSRPVTAHSGILPGPVSGGTDSHLYFGWYHGKERDLQRLLRSFPRIGRFVSEFGAQSVPVDSSFVDTRNWPDLDWVTLGRERGLQKTFFERTTPAHDYLSFEAWKAATQAYQSTLLRRQIEEIRRIKYRPNGGFAFFSLADPIDHPAVSWSVLGHDRQPKSAFEAVQEACRPVIVTMDRPPEVVAVGDALIFDVHAVSDVRHVLRGALVRAELRWPGGGHVWTWKGDLAADACTRIGTVDFVVPSPAHPAALERTQSDPTLQGEGRGVIRIDLTLEHPESTATNRYEARFV